jgi:hypothetical protein
LIANITSGNHSKINVTNGAVIRGALQVDFSSVSPVVGQSWNLVEAEGFDGDFSSISVTGAGTLGAGEAFRTRTVENGSRLTRQITLDRLLTLTVNRSNGTAQIDNVGSAAISFDGYRIKSALSGLSVSNWTSVEDQAIGDWQEANPTANRLVELRETGSTSVGALSSSASLGGVFAPNPPAWGVDPEDLVFEYNVPGQNDTIQGFVKYTGNKAYNDFVLTVDPNSGKANLTNESQFFTATIDGCRILSASNSLTPGSWSSLEDQAIGDWQEANPSSGVLAELFETGATHFATSSNTKFDLGTIFNAGSGTQDLVLQYLFEGEATSRVGVVVYEPIVAVAGDYNGNGIVDAADYTIWRNTLGSTSDLRANGDNTGASMNVIDQADYSFWKSRFGNTSGSGSGAGAVAVGAVPEPSASTFVVLVLVGLSICWHPRRTLIAAIG